MLQTIYNILVSIVGNPNTFTTLQSAPGLVQLGAFILYISSCLIVLCTISFVFKFILKLVDR